MPRALDCRLFVLVAASWLAPAPADARVGGRESSASDDGSVRHVVVKPRTLKNGVVVFPSLDHPRVQALFHSDEFLGPSLFDGGDPMREPRILVRANVARTTSRNVEVVDPKTARQARRRARRYAHRLMNETRKDLERCYARALGRNDRRRASKVVFRFSVERGRVSHAATQIGDGELVDLGGNGCALGVLDAAFIEAEPFEQAVNVELPVWFWLENGRELDSDQLGPVLAEYLSD